jgi:tetratricopeptide (TPR) repeat protein
VTAKTIALWLLLSVTAASAVACSSSSQSAKAPTAAQRMNAEGLRRLERGDGEAAEAMFREALREAELVDDLLGQAEAWNNLGALASARGRSDQAWAMHAAALRLHRARNTRDVGEVRTRTNLGAALLGAGKDEDARAQFEAAATLAGELGKPESAYLARVGLASLALKRGDAPLAARLAADVAASARKSNDDGATAAALATEGSALEMAGDLASAKARFDEALTLDRSREQPLAVAMDLRSLALLAERRGDRKEAASLWGRSARISRLLGQLDDAERALSRALTLLGPSGGDEATGLREELDALRAAREKQRHLATPGGGGKREIRGMGEER